MAKALVWVLCAMGVGAVATAQTLPPGFQLLPVFTGLTDPTAIRFAQDGRIFVAEKSGLLWAYDGLDDSSPTRVLDLRTQVHNFWDRGFLGLAVSPNFPVDPSVYVAYTHDVYPDLAGPRWGSSDPVSSTSDPCPTPPGPTTNGCVVYGRLSRVVIDPLTLLGVEQPLIQGQWCAQFPSHTVGDLAFGPDGYLYMSAGEGASFHFTDTGQAGNPPNPCNDPIDEGGALRSQDLLTPSDPTTLDGTILRLDVSGPTPLAPPDNPLVSNGVPDDDFIVAMGLRNPFRFTIRPGTSEIWLGDVGWNDWEEIDRLANPLGDVENLGWPCYEGPVEHPTYRTRSLCVALRNGNVPPGIALIAPYFYYSHDDPVVAGETCPTGGASLTGVAFNSGTNFPPGYDGALFFADAARNCIWAMFPGASGDPDPATRVTFLASGSQASERVRPVDLQLGPDGNLYVADFEGGRIVRVQHTEGNLPPDAVFSASQTSGSGPLTVDFDAGASSDPEDGTNLLYAWDLDGDGAFDDSTSVNPSFTYQQSGVYLVRLRVRDTRGGTDFASTTITVDDTPPIPTITSPGTELLWRVDQEISFSGMAVDPENGPLPPSQLMWEILLHHCATLLSCHSHPLTTIHDTASRSFFAPDHEYPAFLELRLTATDLPSGDWFDTAWAKRREIRIDNSAQAQALDDFPVLVLLDSTRIDYAATSPAGEDLRFTDSVGNVLAHEIEEWDSTGASVVWVKVPHIDAASSAGFIWMYYDNPEASDAQDPTGVWSNGYAAVWHLSADLADSSAYQNDGTNNGSAQVDGALAGGRFFNGTQWIGIPSSPSLEISGTLSLEAWVQIQNPNLSGARRIVDKKNLWTDPAGFDLEQNAALNHVSAVGGNNTNLRAGGIDLDTTWHYLAANFSGTSGSIFVDGVNRTTDSTVNPVVAGTQSLAIGRRSGGGDYWVGALDEVRVSNVGRSASWLAAQYLSMTDSLLNFEDERALAVLSATTAVMLQPETVELTFESSPPGLQIFTSSESVATPFTRTVIVNSLNSVEAPSPQTLDGTAYGFSSWSDGGSQIHFVAAPEAPTTLLASFQVLPPCSDTFDNDGDGLVDYPSDPGCLDAQYDTESPACDDEIDNDGDGKIDWDGAGSSEPDPQCWTAWRGTEAGKRCGLGFELVFLLSLIQSLRRLRRGRRGWTMRSR